MGEAQKVKDRFVVVPSRAVWPEVHEAGLGLVEFKPVAAQPGSVAKSGWLVTCLRDLERGVEA